MTRLNSMNLTTSRRVSSWLLCTILFLGLTQCSEICDDGSYCSDGCCMNVGGDTYYCGWCPGEIAGAAVGSFFVLVILVLLCCCCACCRRRRQEGYVYVSPGPHVTTNVAVMNTTTAAPQAYPQPPRGYGAAIPPPPPGGFSPPIPPPYPGTHGQNTQAGYHPHQAAPPQPPAYNGYNSSGLGNQGYQSFEDHKD